MRFKVIIETEFRGHHRVRAPRTLTAQSGNQTNSVMTRTLRHTHKDTRQMRAPVELEKPKPTKTRAAL